MPQRLVAEEHVLDDVEVVAQRQVLIDRRDADGLGVTRPVETNRLSLPHELSLVGLPQPGDRLDRHRLAGAVVAGQRRHLARRDVEPDARQRLHGAEPLGHPAKRQQRRGR